MAWKKDTQGNWKETVRIPNKNRSMDIVLFGVPGNAQVAAVDSAQAEAYAMKSEGNEKVRWLFEFDVRGGADEAQVLNKITPPYQIELDMDVLEPGEQYVIYYKVKYYDGGQLAGSSLTSVEEHIAPLSDFASQAGRSGRVRIPFDWGDPAIGIR